MNFLKRKIFFLIGGGISALSGCAADPTIAPDRGEAQRRQLIEAGQRIAQSLETLAVVEQASNRIDVQTMTSPDHGPEELRVRVAVDYQGDIKPFVHQLAQVVGYEVKIYGPSSGLAPVNVQTEDRTIGELLADAGWQTSWRCRLVVRPENRRVDIFYDYRPPGHPRRGRRG